MTHKNNNKYNRRSTLEIQEVFNFEDYHNNPNNINELHPNGNICIDTIFYIFNQYTEDIPMSQQ